MTPEQAKKAIKNGIAVIRKDEPDFNNWLILTCLSDCETGAYYKIRGMGFFRSFAMLDDLITQEQYNQERKKAHATQKSTI